MKNVFDFRAKSVNYSGEKLSASEIFRIRSILIVFLADSKGGGVGDIWEWVFSRVCVCVPVQESKTNMGLPVSMCVCADSKGY